MAAPLAGLRGGPRFGVLGLAFGSGTGGSTVIGSCRGGGRSAINALPPAKTVLASVNLSARASIDDTPDKICKSNFNARASSAALVTRAVATSSQLGGKASSAALVSRAVTTSSKLSGKASSAALVIRAVATSSQLGGKASSAALATVSRLASANFQSKASIAVNASIVGNVQGSSRLQSSARSAALVSKGLIAFSQISGKPSSSATALVTRLSASNLASRSSSAATAIVTAGAVKIASSAMSGSSRMAVNSSIFITKTASCQISSRAIISDVPIVVSAIQLQARFNTRSSIAVNRSVAFIVKGQLQSNANMASTGIGPAGPCECPDYLNLLPLVCGYSNGDLLGNPSVTYDVADIINGQFEKTKTLVDTSTREESLVNTYKRIGCM